MQTTKSHLLNLHICIVIFDYSITLWVIPFVLLPEMAFYPLGLVRFLGGVNGIQLALWVFNTGCIGIAIVLLYESRFNTLCDMFSPKLSTFWETFRKPWILFQYGITAIGSVPFGILTPDQNLASQLLFENLPRAPKSIYNTSVFVVADDYTYHCLTWIAFVVVACLESNFFIYFLVYNLTARYRTKTMSQKTYKMQKAFLIALSLPVLVPMTLICIPIFYGWFSIFTKFYNQAMTNMIVLIALLHGFMSSLVMILVHRPYREAVLFMIGKRVTIDKIQSSIGSTKTIKVVPING